MRDIEPTWDPRRDMPGGQLLRALRGTAGMSLEALAGQLQDAEVRTDAAHLQRIETGRIARPDFETVDAILTAGLKVSYRTRRNVLDAYGYRLPWVLPDEREVEEARRLFAQELEVTTWPAYLMDHGHRLWAWNRYVPRLLGLAPDDPAPARFVGLTTLDLVFNPALGVNLMIDNSEVFPENFLGAFKVQTQPYAHESWFRELIDRARGWPGFSAVWDRLPDVSDEMIETGRIHPIAFRVPGYAEPLRFRIVLIYLAVDPRFQVVSLIPFGATSMRYVAQWAEEEGER